MIKYKLAYFQKATADKIICSINFSLHKIMDTENKANRKPGESDKDHQDTKNLTDSEYRFMDQVIRKKPVDWKKIVLRFVWIVVAGVLIGLIAAAVLVRMVPELKQAYVSHKLGGTITISLDEDPAYREAVAVSSSSSDENSSSSVSLSSVSTSSAESTENLPVSSVSDAVDSASESVDCSSVSSSSETSGVTTDSHNRIHIASGNGDTPAEENSGTVSCSSEATDAENGDNGIAGNSGNQDIADSGITLEEYGQLYQQMADLADTVSSSIVTVTGITSEMDYFDQGYLSEREASGLIVAENSTQMYILTEYRVISDAESIQVKLPDGTLADAHVRKADAGTGLCILYIPLSLLGESTKTSCQIATLGNSYAVKKGEPVLALGSPSGYSDSVEFGAVTSVSSNAYLTDNVYKLLATDVKGASGGSGVLVDMDGSVIGVIDQNLSPDGGETVTALAVSGIKPLIETLSNNTEIPYIGITGQEVSDTIAQQTGMPAGVLVTNVADDSPAMLSGLKTYDVITEISGKTITTFRDYHNLLYSLHPGDVVTVTAMRKGAEGYTAVSFNVSIGSR